MTNGGWYFGLLRHMGGFALQHLGPWSIEIQNLCFVYDPLGPHFGAYTRAVFSHSPSKWLWMKNQNQFQYITTLLRNIEKNQTLVLYQFFHANHECFKVFEITGTCSLLPFLLNPRTGSSLILKYLRNWNWWL
jgi:hypothetical protein